MSEREAVSERRHWSFWPLALVGWGLMVFAVRGLFQHQHDTHPGAVLRTVVGVDLVHDLMIAPIVVAIGAVLARVVRPPARGPIIVGLVITGVTALYAYPLVRGFGRSPTTPSRLSNNYAMGLSVVLAAVWIAVALATGVAALRARRAR